MSEHGAPFGVFHVELGHGGAEGQEHADQHPSGRAERAAEREGEPGRPPLVDADEPRRRGIDRDGPQRRASTGAGQARIEREAEDGRDQQGDEPGSNINLAANYRFGRNYEAGLYTIGGETIGAQFTIALNPLMFWLADRLVARAEPAAVPVPAPRGG